MDHAEEVMGMRKILAHDIRMKKNPQSKEDTFWTFWNFLELCVSKVQLAPPQGNFVNGATNLKSSICCFFIYFKLT